ncbi:MAG: DUF192 domain-containing protein [Blastocatellia bacterium]
MKFFHRATGQLLAEEVALANTFLTRLRGLIARSRLAPAQALWLRPCNGVHTWWMHYSIDVIFLDRDLRIVKLVENMRPFRLTAPHREARSVLEMAAHSISRAQLKIGDQLELVRETTKSTPQATPKANR